MSHESFITYIPNAFAPQLCDEIIDVFNTNDDKHILTIYGEGENTNTQKIHMDRSPSFLFEKHSINAQCRSLNESIRMTLCEILSRHVLCNWLASFSVEQYCFTGFQLRQMIGETREHIDDVDPILVHDFDGSVILTYRIATIIVTLNDTNDRIVFPAQQKEFKLTKGGLLCFPPYWMYPHKSVHTGSNTPRISLQTWLVRRTKVAKAHMSQFV